MKRDAQLSKERDRIADGKRPEDLADDRFAAAPEIRVGDDRVRDVAATAAADQDLRTRPVRALEDCPRTVPRSVQHHRPAEAEMRPEERARQPDVCDTVHPERQLGVVRYAG